MRTPSRTGRRRGSGRRRVFATLVATVCLVGSAGVAPAAAKPHPKHHQPAPITVLTKKLNGPRQLTTGWGLLIAAQSDSGRVTAINPRNGHKFTMVRHLNSPQGVAVRGGRIYIATGASEPDADAPPTTSTSGLMVARPGGTARMFADLTAYELKHNPDRQIQFGPDGAPLDALSNPYYVLRDRHGFLLVADAGANDVLKVNKHGKIKTFYVPPTIKTGACATVPNNTKSGYGCDSVPTGLAYGPNGLLYISALTSEVPNEGRVYVVNRHGHLVRTIKGFSAPTGVVVDKHGTVYVSELLQGAPTSEQLPPGFDPSTVGQIVRVPRHGHRSYAQATMPSGVLIKKAKLYSSAWAIASMLGMNNAGQVVQVRPSAFKAKSGS